MSDEVTKLITSVGGKVVGSGNMQVDSMVKEDDLLMLCDVNEGSKLTDNEFFVFGDFSSVVWVSKEDCCLGGCEGDVPLPMCLDIFACFWTDAGM